MENKSNNYSGYPITYERELPFDKSGSQFVNELPKKHDRTTAMATICYVLGVITDSPSKNHLTDECGPIRFGLLYELTKSEGSKPEDSGSKWMKIYPEVEDLYRAIIIAQDELSPNARQHETRGVLEQRTFDKLTEKLEQKLLTSEPLNYVDYVYLNTPQISRRLLRGFQSRLTENFKRTTNDIKTMPADQAIDILCTALPLANEIRRSIQDRKEAWPMDSIKNAEPAPNSTDLSNLRSDLLSKRKAVYSEGIRRHSKHKFDCRIQIHDEKSSDNDKMLKRYFDCPGAVKNQRKYDDSALPYYKAWLLNQLDLTITRKGDSLREAYRFYRNFLDVKSIESVREYAAQKIQERIDEMFDDLSRGQFIPYYCKQIQYGSAVDIFLDGLLRNVYEQLSVKVHEAFMIMIYFRRIWGIFGVPLEWLHRLQTGASFDTADQEQIQQLVKKPVWTLRTMLEHADSELRQDQDYMQLDLCNIPKIEENPDAKWLIFCENKQKGMLLKNCLCEAHKICAAYLDADSKESEEWEKLCREERFDEQVMLCTTVLDCGVNIHDKKLRHIVLAADNQTTFIQCIGRKRLDSNETLQVHVLEMSSKTLAGRRASITRRLNRVQKFDAGNHLDILDMMANTSDPDCGVLFRYNSDAHYQKGGGVFKNKEAEYVLRRRKDFYERMSSDKATYREEVARWLGNTARITEENHVLQIEKFYAAHKNVALTDDEKGEFKNLVFAYAASIGIDIIRESRKGASKEVALNHILEDAKLPFALSRQWVLRKFEEETT